MKPPVYHYAVLVGFPLGVLFLPMGCRQTSVSFESTEPEPSSLLPIQTQQEQSTASPASSVSVKSSQVESSSRKINRNVMTSQQGSSGKAANPGTLRMSNQTNQPVRLALLSRRSLNKGSSSGQTKDAVPAHWDFAPQEGNEKGLILALPNGQLELQKGDILVAFAQDGSRRYWGPYVVGETSLPSWNSQNKEWQLILSP
ncbi:hypothetical protein [Brasilonema sp. UFV-L1]|uniref:hypothetical protein n=1 Tax=Brasilonema sp. UFV-L1 TaxID=2234130 RepID=UPI00145D15AF|nr:hypothetical protein [Brasilonema sp. UFV-L1]NMG07748.1 hypothetical protein [Brasilonema sp. UFV-L1]